MDKLMNNPWVMKIIALLLALMLYLSVSLDNEDTNTILGTDSSTSSNHGTETITDVPVDVSYSQDNMIIRGVPETVTVTLEGPKNALTQAKLARNFQVYVDLNNYSLGTHQVKLQYRNISDRLDVSIEPEFITVNIEEQKSRKFAVEASFDKSKVKKGYSTGTATVNPETVTVTGSESQLSQIAYVKAIVELDDISKTVNEQAAVIALDKNLNKLNVSIEPEVVNVTIPVESRNKKVPIKVVETGTAPEGVKISSIDVEPEEVTLIGSKDVLENINSIDDIPINISDISKTTELKVEVPVPDGVDSVSPKRITVRVEVEKQDEEVMAEDEEQAGKKSFTNLPVSLNGQSPKYNYEIVTPRNGRVNVDVSGDKEVLSGIRQSDLKLSADVSNLTAGEFSVPIAVKAPKSVNTVLSTRQLKVRVTEVKQSTNDQEDNEPTEEKPDESVGSVTDPPLQEEETETNPNNEDKENIEDKENSKETENSGSQSNN
ncbi:YbbR-like domain-containing protein [Priestia megaterium]|nr:YbbR-like domain-containing protein [Priestia megaterium]